MKVDVYAGAAGTDNGVDRGTEKPAGVACQRPARSLHRSQGKRKRHEHTPDREHGGMEQAGASLAGGTTGKASDSASHNLRDPHLMEALLEKQPPDAGLVHREEAAGGALCRWRSVVGVFSC